MVALREEYSSFFSGELGAQAHRLLAILLAELRKPGQGMLPISPPPPRTFCFLLVHQLLPFLKHWIRLELHNDIVVQQLKMFIEPSDSSYMPSLVVVSGGETVATLKEIRTINVGDTESILTILSDASEVKSRFSAAVSVLQLAPFNCTWKQYYRFIEISVKHCKSNGIDCRVHGLSIIGRVGSDDEDYTSVSSFLVPDLQDDIVGTENLLGRKKMPTLVPGARSELQKDYSHTKVYVWGLNDKDQLGGLKGSKVSVPYEVPHVMPRFHLRMNHDWYLHL